MVRIREIKKYGNSKAIKLEPADMKDFNIVVGDRVDIEELQKITDQNITKILMDQRMDEDGNEKNSQ